MSESVWSVTVVRSLGNYWRTVFRVGVQSFTIAQADDDEAEAHCEGMRRMFTTAIERVAAAERARTVEECVAAALNDPHGYHSDRTDNVVNRVRDLQRQGKAER